MKLFTFLVMLFLHVYDDYYHQCKSFLVEGKQKKWWKENSPDPLYNHDYLIVLLLHAFSWSFMVHIPLIVIKFLESDMLFIPFSLSIIAHTLTHAMIDDLKANKFKINLIEDQLMHILQLILICITFF